MTDKLEIIMKTAKMLADDNRGEWSGDVHEFATASAYVTPDERLWLTSHDVKVFHKELKQSAFISEYAYVSASYANGEPLLIVQDVDSGKV
jgi:predicted house-cleaning NTP pyrophosphatase (Maf/HAM1 superfamily)